MSDMDTSPPNPGSDEAIKMGCKCPIMDNNHGKYAPWPPDGWWMVADCPIHQLNNATGDSVVQEELPHEAT